MVIPINLFVARDRLFRTGPAVWLRGGVHITTGPAKTCDIEATADAHVGQFLERAAESSAEERKRCVSALSVA